MVNMESENTISESIIDIIDTFDDHLKEHNQIKIDEFNMLGEKCMRIHTGFLFYRYNIQFDQIPQLCSEIYAVFVRRIGGTKSSAMLADWKDLGHYLGLNSEEICYIENTKSFICPTDTVLQVYTQKEDATMGSLIKALLSIERHDVIEGVFEPLNKLTDLLIDNCKRDPDQGYYSNTSKTESRYEIIKPKYIYNNLPEVLQSGQIKTVLSKDDKTQPFDDNSKNDSSLGDEIPEKKYKHSVLLTYVEDGLSVARDISAKIQGFRNGDDRIRVVCLENEKSTVLTNPEQYIRNYFEEVDYVLPILTDRYISTIKSPVQVLGSTTQNVDCKYARFIYTLMSSYYINGKGCLNDKVRPVLSQEISPNLLSSLCMYPMLCVWTWEKEFETLLESLFMNDANCNGNVI